MISQPGLTPQPGIPSGGTTGKALIKSSDTNFDVEWGAVSASAVWGSITGTLSDQTDLQTALDAKVPTSRTVNGQALSSNVELDLGDVGFPSGGTTDQYLAKNSDTSYDLKWVTMPTPDFIPGKTATNFAALPSAATYSGYMAIVLNAQGVWLINYKAAGLYYSDGVDWLYQGDYTLTDQASEISYTPTGSISATNVQDAISEVAGDVGLNSGNNLALVYGLAMQ